MREMTNTTGEGGTDHGALDARRARVRTLTHRLSAAEPELPFEGRLGSFERGTGWLNTEPLTSSQLRGRVVLVDFWTYTCVNWLRTLPYLREWHRAYSHQGLTIVGVHTPEFSFERDPDNVEKQCHALGVSYPVLLDAHYGVWEEFANHYWPALYLADGHGRIRYHHFGEGEYASTEMVIQRLLMDNGADVADDLSNVSPTGLEVAADWANLRSPETYLGFGRSDPSAPGGLSLLDRPHTFRPESDLPLNAWDLAGTWTVSSESVRLEGGGGRLRINFHARDVNLVMGSTSGTPIPFAVTVDDQAPGESAGADLPPSGHGELRQPGTYQLVRQPGSIRDRTFEIEFLAAGAEAFCFTFG